MDPSTPVARKDHGCHFCGRTIRAGVRYQYEKVTAWESRSGGGDAVFWTYRAHLGCHSAWWSHEWSDEPWDDCASEFRMSVLGEPECLAEDDDPLVYRAAEHYEQRRRAVLGDRHRRGELADAG